MKAKYLVIPIAILVVLSTIAISLAQITGDVAAAKAAASIDTLNVLGKGLAVSTSDPLDFQLVGVGIARTRIKAGNGTEVKAIGVFTTDGSRYKLTDVIVSNGSASANIQLNGSKIGQFILTQFSKENANIWAGTLSLNGKSFNMYILGAKLELSGEEMKEKVSEYCHEHGEDSNCKQRIADFCADNLGDQRCKDVFRVYCRAHLDDARCQAAIQDYCVNNTEAAICLNYTIDHTKTFCERYPKTAICQNVTQRISDACADENESDRCDDFCKRNPLGCQVAAKVRERLDNESIKQAVQDKIRERTANIATAGD